MATTTTRPSIRMRPRGPSSCCNARCYHLRQNLGGAGTASGTSPARIDLTWTGIPNVTGYDVLRSTTNGGPYTEIGRPAQQLIRIEQDWRTEYVLLRSSAVNALARFASRTRQPSQSRSRAVNRVVTIACNIPSANAEGMLHKGSF